MRDESPRRRLARVGLTRLQKRCLALGCVDGLTYGEVAIQLGMSINGVRQHLHRAKKKLEAAGLRIRRPVTEEIVLILMDPGRINKIPLEQIRARW